MDLLVKTPNRKPPHARGTRPTDPPEQSIQLRLNTINDSLTKKEHTANSRGGGAYSYIYRGKYTLDTSVYLVDVYGEAPELNLEL